MQAVRLFLWMLFLTGIGYPFLVTAIGVVSMSEQAHGSLKYDQEKVIGSTLIAQKFVQEHYFWPRPSAVDYRTLPSGGSNLGPTSLLLKKEVERRRALYSAEKVPSDLLFASGSGLDPHISLESAYLQSARVAGSRGMELDKVHGLIKSLTKKRLLGFLGERYVNVLELNLALDKEGRNGNRRAD